VQYRAHWLRALLLDDYKQARSIFIATTSNQLRFKRQRDRKAGTYAKADTTAFSTLINPQAVSYINGGNGSATSPPVEAGDSPDHSGDRRELHRPHVVVGLAVDRPRWEFGGTVAVTIEDCKCGCAT
jgi:hypothetical protein